LRWEGVTAKEFLVFSFVGTSIQDEPIGSWIADAVAESGIETEAGFVDKVIHVALDAAVVVAEKNHPLSPGHKYPAREVNRAYPTQAAAPDDMPRTIIHGRKDPDGRQKPYEPGLETTHRAELIRDVVIFEARQVLRMLLIRGGAHLRIGFLQTAKSNHVKRDDYNKER
jgi:hypothetical protein